MNTTHSLLLRIISGFACVLLLGTAAASASDFKVLVFSKTAGFRHASITNGLAAIRQLGTNNHFDVVATENAADFNATNLAQFAAVIFLSTTGDVLDVAQQAVFENYIRAGGGFVGIHAASDTEYSWPWYGGLVGAWFSGHPPGTPRATVLVEDRHHPSTCFLPEGWVRNDEWYNFQTNPRATVHVLCRLDESTYTGGTLGDDHPISWRHDYDGGRAWYTGLGHTTASFDEPHFRSHILGGIQYAANSIPPQPPGALVLFDGRDAAHWTSTNGAGMPWQITNNALTVVPGTGNVRTVEVFEDYLLHVEFLIPSTPGGTPEGSLNNSGLYLHGSYEIQIMESFGRPIAGANESGSIYGQQNPSSNAALPAGVWETFDINFRAPRWNGVVKTENARVTVWWNEVLVQNSVEIPSATGAGAPEDPFPGPVVLQDLVGPVKFRNLWILPRAVVPRLVPTQLVLPGALWRCLDDGSAPAAAWRSNNFSDLTWTNGRAQFGYGDGDEAAVIRSNRVDTSRIITTYFRKPFTATNVASLTNLEVRLLRDDGAIVYLNGAEVFRSNMTNAAVDSTTTALTGIANAAELQWVSTNVNPALLLDGANLLAVEIHQNSATSSDVSFDLALTALGVPAPDLTATTAGPAFTLAWPALPGGHQLERAALLASNQWTAVTNALTTVTNVRSSVTLTNPGAGNAFFRLRKN